MDTTQTMVILFYVCIACAAILLIIGMVVFFALVVPSIRNEKKEPAPDAAPSVIPQAADDGMERTAVLSAPAPRTSVDLSATTATLPVLKTPRFEIVKKVICCDTQETID